MKKSLIFIFVICLVFPAHAAIQTKMIEYRDGDTALEGYVAFDDSILGKRPGILVVHDWMGFGSFGNKKAEELAKLGYTALAVDIYGKSVRPQNTQEAGTQSTIYKSDRNLLRRRILAGYERIKEEPTVNAQKIGVIGFCFGGTTALELARSGAPISAVVSFHGGLDSPTPGDANKIKAKILVLHGADDPLVPQKEVSGFENEMRSANVDWQLIKYSGAVHSFTNPAAGNDISRGVAYNEKADQRSWMAMKAFFEETLRY